MRAVVIDGSGAILRTVTAPEEMIALQVGVGETALGLVDESAGYIDDANVKVTDGAFEAIGGFAGPLPDTELVVL